MISKEAFEKFPLYHEYIPGTYKDLSYEERKYYIDLIKNSPNKSTQDFYTFSADHDIAENLHNFLSDFSTHLEEIEDKINDEMRPLYDGNWWFHLADDFSNDSFYQSIAWAEYDNDDRLEINMEYDQSAEYVYVDVKLISEEYINSKIKEYLIKLNKKYVDEISIYKYKIDTLTQTNNILNECLKSYV